MFFWRNTGIFTALRPYGLTQILLLWKIITIRDFFMAENNNNNNSAPGKKNDQNAKRGSIRTGIFAVLAISLILFQIFSSGKTAQKATTSTIKEMIVNRDIEKIIVVNKDMRRFT